jgi:hypothetical protein
MIKRMKTPDSSATDPSQNAAMPVANAPAEAAPQQPSVPTRRPREIGGPSGLEPTRYGDWERNGRVSDF